MTKPDFASDFDRTVESWRRKHGIQEDDAILLCVELFRIHQEHWDRIRHQEMPAFQEFRDSILKLQDAAKIVQRQSSLLIDQLRRTQNRKTSPGVSRTTVAVIIAAGFGIAIGKFVL